MPNECLHLWLESFNSEEKDDEFGIWRKLSINPETEMCEDEWLWEYFVETDYTLLTQADFENEVKKYMLFQLKQLEIDEFDKEDDDSE